MDYAALATMALTIFFNLMQASGKTKEEAEAFYQAEKAKFQANIPEALPDV